MIISPVNQPAVLLPVLDPLIVDRRFGIIQTSFKQALRSVVIESDDIGNRDFILWQVIFKTRFHMQKSTRKNHEQNAQEKEAFSCYGSLKFHKPVLVKR